MREFPTFVEADPGQALRNRIYIYREPCYISKLMLAHELTQLLNIIYYVDVKTSNRNTDIPFTVKPLFSHDISLSSVKQCSYRGFEPCPTT